MVMQGTNMFNSYRVAFRQARWLRGQLFWPIDHSLQLCTTKPGGTIDVMPQLYTRNPGLDCPFADWASAMCSYEGWMKALGSRHVLIFWDIKIIAKFSKTRKASSIILQSDWEHTVSHDKVLADDYFQREKCGFWVHFHNSIRGESRSKAIRGENMRMEGINQYMVLGVWREMRALQTHLGQW